MHVLDTFLPCFNKTKTKVAVVAVRFKVLPVDFKTVKNQRLLCRPKDYFKYFLTINSIIYIN